MANKLDALRAGLGRTLDQANKSESRKTAKLQPPDPKTEGCEKLSLSLFATDLSKLKDIQTFLAGKGELVSRSMAVKLALRLCKVSDALLDALAEARAEDGRKWK